MDDGNHKDDTEQNNKSAAETVSLNEYSSCQFRFDINVNSIIKIKIYFLKF